MSVFKDLENYTDGQLKDELDRRNTLRLKGLCSYCKNPLDKVGFRSEKRCRFHEKFLCRVDFDVDVEVVGG